MMKLLIGLTLFGFVAHAKLVIVDERGQRYAACWQKNTASDSDYSLLLNRCPAGTETVWMEAPLLFRDGVRSDQWQTQTYEILSGRFRNFAGDPERSRPALCVWTRTAGEK